MSAVDLLRLPFLKVYRNTIAEVVTTIVGHSDCSSVHTCHGHTYVFTVFHHVVTFSRTNTLVMTLGF